MWRPTGDRVLIRLDTQQEKVSAGGVVLPGQAVESELVRYGTVEAVGRDADEVVVGDRLVVSGYAGTSLEGDEALRIVKQGEILVVLHEG